MSIERKEKIQRNKDKELYKFECKHRENRSKSSFRLSERSRSYSARSLRSLRSTNIKRRSRSYSNYNRKYRNDRLNRSYNGGSDGGDNYFKFNNSKRKETVGDDTKSNRSNRSSQQFDL